MMSNLVLGLAFVLTTLCIHQSTSQAFNPTILQDSRDLPKTDGTFGFLYRTEDGIAHAAKGDSDGVIHGRFSYTDPTGLKVNYNYNAGSRVTPGYNYNEPAPARPKYRSPPPQQFSQPEPTYRQSEPSYEEPQEYRRPPPSYRQPAPAYQQRRTRPPLPPQKENEVYDDYYSRG